MFDRELNRVADRLRVLGPRLDSRPGGQDSRPGEPLARVRADLQRLADLAADAEGLPRREVPILGPHALADQFLVLGHDLLAAGDAVAVASGTDLLVRLRREL